MSDVLEFETRKKIYDLIEQHPGVHLSKIADLLQLSIQLIDYHLHYLEVHNFISLEKESGYCRCYIKGQIGIEDRQLISVLRQETPLRIIFYLLKFPHSRHKDLLKALNMSSPRLSYHLRKLVKLQIVMLTESVGFSGYVVRNEREVLTFLIRYKPTTILENVHDTWMDFTPG